jgi:hypothetical protein
VSQQPVQSNGGALAASHSTLSVASNSGFKHKGGGGGGGGGGTARRVAAAAAAYVSPYGQRAMLQQQQHRGVVG